MDFGLKAVFSGLAVLLTLMAFVPYIASILKNEIKPHVFTWVIWGTTTVIVFFAQLDAAGGMGAWPIGISGAITVLIALLAYVKRSDVSITKVDWLFFLAALASLPFWYFTSNPMWAVVLLTLIDLLGFGPTMRKAYDFPHQESIAFFILFIARNLCVLLALESYSIATVLFPLSVSSACFVLLVVVFYRRRILCV